MEDVRKWILRFFFKDYCPKSYSILGICLWNIDSEPVNQKNCVNVVCISVDFENTLSQAYSSVDWAELSTYNSFQ